MGYKTSDDHNIPPNDDSEEPDHSDSETQPDKTPNKSNRSDHGDDDFPPLPGLGLPEDWDPKHIPTTSQLRAAADQSGQAPGAGPAARWQRAQSSHRLAHRCRRRLQMGPVLLFEGTVGRHHCGAG